MPGRKALPPAAKIMDLLPDWMRELKAENKSQATLNQYRKNLSYFCRWLSPTGDEHDCTTRVTEVDTTMLQEWFGHCYDHWSEASVNISHIVLSVFFEFAIAYDELPSGVNPVRSIKRPKVNIKPVPVLGDEQIRKLLAIVEHGKAFRDKRDYAIFRTFLSTGMRLAELEQLLLADVELDKGVIHIRRGKGGKGRYVQIGPRTVRVLSQYIHVRMRHKDAHLPDLWLGPHGRLQYGGIRHMVQERAKEAGLEGLHAHLFRHAFAHGFLANGGQESDLLQLAGWSDSKMLRERYGASLKQERAIDNARKIGMGERW